jgi:hypothetical protein
VKVLALCVGELGRGEKVMCTKKEKKRTKIEMEIYWEDRKMY